MMNDKPKKAKMSTPMKILIVMIVVGILFIGVKVYGIFSEESHWLNLVGYGLIFAEVPLLAILMVEMKK